MSKTETPYRLGRKLNKAGTLYILSGGDIRGVIFTGLHVIKDTVMTYINTEEAPNRDRIISYYLTFKEKLSTPLPLLTSPEIVKDSNEWKVHYDWNTSNDDVAELSYVLNRLWEFLPYLGFTYTHVYGHTLVHIGQYSSDFLAFIAKCEGSDIEVVDIDEPVFHLHFLDYKRDLSNYNETPSTVSIKAYGGS